MATTIWVALECSSMADTRRSTNIRGQHIDWPMFYTAVERDAILYCIWLDVAPLFSDGPWQVSRSHFHKASMASSIKTPEKERKFLFWQQPISWFCRCSRNGTSSSTRAGDRAWSYCLSMVYTRFLGRITSFNSDMIPKDQQEAEAKSRGRDGPWTRGGPSDGAGPRAARRRCWWAAWHHGRWCRAPRRTASSPSSSSLATSKSRSSPTEPTSFSLLLPLHPLSPVPAIWRTKWVSCWFSPCGVRGP